MKVRKMVMWLSAALVGLVVSACASDEPKTEINYEVVQAYKAGGEIKCFKIADVDIYVRDNPHSKWKRPGNDYMIDLIYDKSILF